MASLLAALLVPGDPSPYIEIALGLGVLLLLLLVEISATQPSAPVSPLRVFHSCARWRREVLLLGMSDPIL